VHGIKRRTSLFNTDRIDHLYKDRHEKDVRFFLWETWSPNETGVMQETMLKCSG
jgi:GDP-D-mannose dehydratase